MEPSKARNRVVYFRISEEEFDRLCVLRQEHGARSLSEIARSAVHALIQPDSALSKANAATAEISGRLDGLERSVSEINMHLQILTRELANQEMQRDA